LARIGRREVFGIQLQTSSAEMARPRECLEVKGQGTMQMRSSRVLRKLRGGEVVTCFKINLADVRSVQIAAQTGFDCLFTDMEHVPNSFTVIENQVLAAKCHDVDLLVRVSRGAYSDYIRPLELDAAGIMVPHIMSVEDAKEVIRMTRFPPIGRRAADGGNADGCFCAVPFEDYLKRANEDRFLVLQIEDPEPLEELDRIAALDGFDMLFFGAGDFSCSINAPGQWDHPLLLEARRMIGESALRNGKFAGTVGSPSSIPELVSLGYRFISCGADVVGLSQYCRNVFNSFEGALVAEFDTDEDAICL
jgi:4-hydroxy-2-oxoheptanedioate aldolase